MRLRDEEMIIEAITRLADEVAALRAELAALRSVLAAKTARRVKRDALAKDVTAYVA